MLRLYQFDLTKASPDDRALLIDKIDRLSDTGTTPVGKFIFRAFFDEQVDVSKLIPLPDGCKVQRITTRP